MDKLSLHQPSFVTRNRDICHVLFDEILLDSVCLQGSGHTNGILMMNSGTKGTWDLVLKFAAGLFFYKENYVQNAVIIKLCIYFEPTFFLLPWRIQEHGTIRVYIRPRNRTIW